MNKKASNQPPQKLGLIAKPRFPDANRQIVLEWMNKYLVDEDFSTKHLDAIAKIISFFNENEQTESSIFGFADRLNNSTDGFNIHVGDKVFNIQIKDGKLKIKPKNGFITVGTCEYSSITVDQEDF